MKHWLTAAALVTVLGLSGQASAEGAKGVGLGVAAGLAYSADDFGNDPIGGRFGWGFFVDIPLLETFYITPSATIYDIETAGVTSSLTDIGLNFKFIVPLGALRLGAGVLTGLTTGLGDYRGHVGALGFGSYNLAANFDFFVMGQYKRQLSDFDINDIHIFGGGMFIF